MSFSDDSGGYRRYLFEYRYDGSEWGLEITARSPAEARERLGALAWACYRGKIAARIPIPGAGLIERISAFFRQFKLSRGDCERL